MCTAMPVLVSGFGYIRGEARESKIQREVTFKGVSSVSDPINLEEEVH